MLEGAVCAHDLLEVRPLEVECLLAIVLVAVAVVVAITSLSPIGLLLLLVAELAAIGLVLALRRRIYAWSLRRRYRPSGRPALEGWTRPR